MFVNTPRDGLLTVWSTLMIQRSMIVWQSLLDVPEFLKQLSSTLWTQLPRMFTKPLQLARTGNGPEKLSVSFFLRNPPTALNPVIHVLLDPACQDSDSVGCTAIIRGNLIHLDLLQRENEDACIRGFLCYVNSGSTWETVPFSVQIVAFRQQPEDPRQNLRNLRNLQNLQNLQTDLLIKSVTENRITYGLQPNVPMLYYLPSSKLRGATIERLFQAIETLENQEVVEIGGQLHHEWKERQNFNKQRVCFDIEGVYHADRDLWKLSLPAKFLPTQQIGDRLAVRSADTEDWLYVGFIHNLSDGFAWVSFKGLPNTRRRIIFPSLRFYFDATLTYVMLHALLRSFSHTSWLFTKPQSRFELIQGPRTSGKTDMLIRRVCDAVARCRRVLVITPDDQTADAFTLRILENGSTRIARVHEWNRDPHTVHPAVLSVSPRDDKQYFTVPPLHEWTFTSGHSASHEGGIWVMKWSTARILEKCDGKFGMRSFDLVAIDDASRMSVTEGLVPLVSACCDEAQILLSGDIKQLGPLYGTSLFHRFFLDKSVKRTELLKNYMGHPHLVKIASSLFYSDRVQSVRSPKFFQLRYGVNDFPLHVHAVEGQTQWDREVNVEEQECIVEIVDSLGPIYLHVAVVASTDSQRELLRAKLPSHVKVLSIAELILESVEVVIVSLVEDRVVDTPDPFMESFLGDPNVINTLLSSASARFVVVGHPMVLHADPIWKPVAEFASSHQTYHQYSSGSGFLPRDFFE